MTDEGYVQLPPDSSGKRIRLLQVTETQSDGTVVTEYQEVVVVADDDGNLLLVGGMGNKSIPVSQKDVVEKLDILIQGIGHLILICERGMRPRSFAGATSDWVSKHLDEGGQ